MRSGGTSDDRTSRDDWPDLVRGFLDGGDAGADRLATALDPFARQHAGAFLGAESPDVEDIASEVVVAVMGHITRAGTFEGNLETFSATVVRNRCRNLVLRQRLLTMVDLDEVADRLAAPGASPLDLVTERERLLLLQQALDSLDPLCARMLTALYIENIPMSKLWKQLGLSALTTAYHRRSRCLKKAYISLKNLLVDCSGSGGPYGAGIPVREREHDDDADQ